MKLILLPLFASLVLVCSSQGEQPTPTPPSDSKTMDAADNTKRNSAEENKNTNTAEKQSNSKDDLALVQKIRQAVMKEHALSMNGKNVKIIVREGKVMLKGPVDNDQEKGTIGSRAEELAGKGNVDNQLEVKAEKK